MEIVDSKGFFMRLPWYSGAPAPSRSRFTMRFVMPPIISDPPQVVYLVLIACVIVTGAIAAQRQNRKSAIAFGIAVALLLAVFLIDRLFDSPREEAVKNTQAMSAAADANNPDAFVSHVADTFVYYGEGPPVTATRSELKGSPFWALLRQLDAHVAVWNFSRDDVKVIDDDTVEIGFMAKGERRGGTMSEQVQLYIRATFKRQSDGKMRVTEFRTFDAVDHKKAFNIPGFPK